MAPRANWEGFLLATCPVALYPAASEPEKVSFNQLNKQIGHRIRYLQLDADTGEEVPNEDIVKDYKLDKENLEISKQEFEEITLESTRIIEFDEFVEKANIDPRYLIRPDGAVIREMNKLATDHVVLTNHEHIIALEPLEKGLVDTLLRYPYEVRSEEEYLDEIQDVKVIKDRLDLAKHIVKQKSGAFEPEKIENHYETALILINQKRAGKPRGENLVDLTKGYGGGSGALRPTPRSKKTAKNRKRRLPSRRRCLCRSPAKSQAKEDAAKKSAARPQRKSA